MNEFELEQTAKQIGSVVLPRIWLQALAGLMVVLIIVVVLQISAVQGAPNGTEPPGKGQNAEATGGAALANTSERKAAIEEAIRAQRARMYERYAVVLSPEELRRLGIPKRPERRGPANLRGLSPRQQDECRKADQTAFFEWAESLTESQKAALEKAAEDAQKAIDREVAAATTAGRVIKMEVSDSKLPDPASGYSWRNDAGDRGLSV